jgi:hypothetical protein
MLMSNFRRILCICLAVAVTGWATTATAQDDSAPPMPQTQINKAQTNAPDSAGLFPSADITTEASVDIPDGVETHPPLRLTPDKSEIVRLDRPVTSLIVSNPTLASVLMDNPKMLVVVPRLPGATYFTALDRDNKIVMQRHIIVASPKQQYVRIRQTCASSKSRSSSSRKAACLPIREFYCPDMCHEVRIRTMEEALQDEAKEHQAKLDKEVQGTKSDPTVMSSEGESEDGMEAEADAPSSQDVQDMIRQLSEKLGETEE